MPKVLNKHIDKIPPGAVYVGRPSKWGNPYNIGHPSPPPFLGMITREMAITLYEAYLHFHQDLVEDARRELHNKDLVCWCAPLPCHADILLELANSQNCKISPI